MVDEVARLLLEALESAMSRRCVPPRVHIQVRGADTPCECGSPPTSGHYYRFVGAGDLPAR
jgi:hypothetical protein